MQRDSIKRLSFYGLISLILSFLVTVVTLAWLLVGFESIRHDGMLVTGTQGALLELKDYTERLLTSNNLEQDRRVWAEAVTRFDQQLERLEQGGRSFEEMAALGRLWRTARSEADRIALQLDHPLLQSRNMLDKPLLRRLGESFQTNATSEFYNALSAAYNSIGYLIQYETFLIDDLSQLVAIHTQEEEARFGKIKLLTILLPSAIWLLSLLVIQMISRWINGVEAELKGYQEGLQSLVEARTAELEEAIQDLREAKETAEAANRAKSVFLANMSHELRTPLNAILGFSQLMAHDRAIPEEERGNLKIINRSGEHLLAMINDVLDLSKIDAGKVELKPTPFDLHGMLQEIGEMIRSRCRAKGLVFTLDIAPETPAWVIADIGKLRQILINLLGNAVKFTESGGVTLTARSDPAAPPATDPGGSQWLVLEVGDTGPGIPADKRDSIFDAFVQLEQSPAVAKGTGLGLAISRSFIGLMGGKLEVESQTGRGARFVLRVPVELPDQTAQLAPAREPPRVIGLAPDQPERRLLVVDDSEENRLLLISLLKRAGFQVKEAENGKEAVELFQTWQPHLIWMDMRMPVMDGYDATARIRELPGGERVHIIALTASAFKEQEGGILNAGCDAIVQKPFREHEIFEVLQSRLEVRFLVEDEGESKDKAAAISISARLGLLPEQLRGELLEAVVECNTDHIEQAIDKINADDPELGAVLRQASSEFDYPRILGYLEAKGAE